MNAITKALSELAYSIPQEILQFGFMERNNVLNAAYSMDEYIMSKVIRPRVLVDCNLVGGIQMTIPVNACNIDLLPSGESVVQVPRTVTNNKKIVTVLSMVANTTMLPVNYNTAITRNDFASAANNMMNNLSGFVPINTSRMELLSDNTILIEDPSVPIIYGSIRVMLENSSNLENISPRNYDVFSELVELAVKAYIYNTTVIKLDKGFIYGGHELGVIKEIIDTYSEANNDYKVFRTSKWKKVAFMNNSGAMDRYVKSMISNNI